MKRVGWLDPLKGLALLSILLNHLVEEFGPPAPFTAPGATWPPLATRLTQFFPSDHQPAVALVRLLGWLGDSGPGVFILASGFGLTWAALARGHGESAGDFYRRRLFRLYPFAVVAHVVVLAGALLVPGVGLTFADPRIVASLAGIRPTPSLFFYIAPAWWYIWLTMQLYLAYPLLDWLLRRWGPLRFGLLTLAITVASRAVILGQPDIRYYWLTGMFAGSRLAELAAGMLLAQWLFARAKDPDRPLSARGLLPASLALYAAGLAASLFLPTVLISTLLVTLGLSGLFLWFWNRLAPGAAADRTLQWLGQESYGIFLLHHAPLKWTAAFWPGINPIHLVAALSVVAASLPAAVLLRRLSERLVAVVIQGPVELWRRIEAGAELSGAGALLFLAGTASIARGAALVAGVASLVLLAAEWRDAAPAGGRSVLRRALLGAMLLQLLVLPQPLILLSLVVGLLIALCAASAEHAGLSRFAAAAAGGVLALGLTVLLDLGLGAWQPIETGRWGEYPALLPHPTRAYGLKPDLSLRLRYNHYDYTVVTNRDSLAGPPIPRERAHGELRVLTMGDAFTMPEGLPYADGYPAQLETRLSGCEAPYSVTVIDGGVTGYGPAEEAPAIEELVPRYRPDIVVYQFFVNEYREVHLTTEARRTSVGFIPPASRRTRLVWRSQLAAWSTRLEDTFRARATGVLSSRERWLAMTDYYVAGPSPLYNDETLGLLDNALRRMREATRAAGATLLLVYVPAAMAVDTLAPDVAAPLAPLRALGPYDYARPERLVLALANSLGIPAIDLTPALRAWPARPLYFPDAFHWTPEGHRAAAQAIARTLAQRGLVDSRCTQ